MTDKNSNHQFNLNAPQIKRLGEQIVPDAVSALAELIKNAYDADADRVSIEINTKQFSPPHHLHFKSHHPGFIKIEDNGWGMNWEEVQSKWMNFSLPMEKTKSKTVTEKKRTPSGGQGMGRLGTLWLGEYVELFTEVESAKDQSHVVFDWNQFNKGSVLNEGPVFAEQLPRKGSKGTCIIVYPLRDVAQWSDAADELITQLANKVFVFTDKNSFRVTLKLDDREIEIGQSLRIRKINPKVYLENVWQQMSPDLVKEVMAFWVENKMLKPDFSSEERAGQVVFLIRSETERKIVGLSTAAMISYKQLNSNNFYLYRSIILPGYRHPGLASKLIVETRNFLESFNERVTSNRCIGMLTFVESPRLQQFMRDAIWPSSKMAYIGMDKMGRHIRVYYFKGALI